MSDGRATAWIQLTIFVTVVLGAVVVHQRGNGQFHFLLISVFACFLIASVSALIWMLWRARRNANGDPER